MPASSDYYQTLGVKRDASSEDIKKAYRRLARKHHPDLNPGDKASEERFKKVQEAFDVLSDSKKKKMYDQFGFYSDSGFPGGAQPPPNAGFGFGGFDFSDAFSGAGQPGGGAFSDIFSQFFGRQQRSESSPRAEKGADLEYSLTIGFWQAIKGTQVRLSINRLDQCAHCRGTGQSGGASASCPQCHGSGNVQQLAGAMKFSLTCPRCGGSGKLQNSCPGCRGESRVNVSENVEVRIPAGAANGSRLRVAAKGNAGTLSAPPGDLYITIRVDDHPLFSREGDDVHLRLPVTVAEAGLGAKIEVPTVDGRALLKIPQGTQNGQKFRLREKGVYNARKNSRGDQIVEIHIQAPDVRDERTRELLRKLSELDPADPRADIWSQV